MSNSNNIDAMSQEFLDGLHTAQEEVLTRFDESVWLDNGRCIAADNPTQYYYLEWHRRARKTTLALNILARECLRVAGGKYTYIAPTQIMAREIAWDDPYMLKAIVPEGLGKFNEQKMTVTFFNGSILKIGGADVIDPHKKRGVDTIGLVFDEWALIPEEVWTMIYRPIIAGSLRDKLAAITRRWVMFLYTPKGVNHATRMFDGAACIGNGGSLPTTGEAAKHKDKCFASRLDADHSGVITSSELAEAKKDMPKPIFDQEFLCARVTEEERSIITTAMLEKVKNFHRVGNEIRRFISCDPSLGGDECVIYVWENTKIIDELYMRERNQKIVAGEIEILARKHKAKTVVVDNIGIGNEIYNRLGEMGLNSIGFNSANEATDKDRFANLKVQAWWQARARVETLDIDYPDDEVLRMQLTSVKFDITRTGKLICEPKDATKKRIGCSPDRADAWIMGIWVLPFVEPLSSQDIAENRDYKSLGGVIIPRFGRAI